MKMVEVKNIKKSFGKLLVLNDISFSLNKGETIAIIGPSGSGKSTTLRSIIELEHIDDGDIIIEGEYLVEKGHYKHESKLRELRNKMGMVFQHFNLFPHMSVKENLLCAPKILKKDSSQNLNSLCLKYLKDVGLIDKIDEMPSRLSGGQKQRVAIARALMMKPDILLFDEPTSSLDPELTGEVLSVIKDLASQKFSMIIVTHEIGFAREAADRVIFMDNGMIIEEGTPKEVIDAPRTERAKTFLKRVYV